MLFGTSGTIDTVKVVMCNNVDLFAMLTLIVFWQTEAHVTLLWCTTLTKKWSYWLHINFFGSRYEVLRMRFRKLWYEVNLRYHSTVVKVYYFIIFSSWWYGGRSQGLGHFGDTVSATLFRRWWSQMFYTKKVCVLKYFNG